MTKQEVKAALSIFPIDESVEEEGKHTEFRISKEVSLEVSDYSITIFAWAIVDGAHTIPMTSGYDLSDIVKIELMGNMLSIQTKTYTGCVIHTEIK